MLERDASTTPLLVVEVDGVAANTRDVPVELLRCPWPTVGTATEPVGGPVVDALDVLLTRAGNPARGWVEVPDLQLATAQLEAAVTHAPVAARVLVQVLRGSESRSVADGLEIESLAYSMLLAGREFARWLATRPTASRQPGGDPVRVARQGDTLRITLTRPRWRNAFNAEMRERLTDALDAATLDPGLGRVVLDGAGPAFCSGGDLQEFGLAEDPASAHLVRLQRGPAVRLARLAHKLEAHVHGPCVGAGIEMAAFAHHVRAAPGAWFRLPELGMGLIPAAGGTVSVSRRIGRQRLAWMALSGTTIDDDTALEWGLVDSIE